MTTLPTNPFNQKLHNFLAFIDKTYPNVSKQMPQSFRAIVPLVTPRMVTKHVTADVLAELELALAEIDLCSADWKCRKAIKELHEIYCRTVQQSLGSSWVFDDVLADTDTANIRTVLRYVKLFVTVVLTSQRIE